jgi:hypothetical protein
MSQQGGCQCGAVRYEVSGMPAHVSICHCEGCRKSAGAPAVAWAAFTEDAFQLLQGDLTEYNSSGAAMRSFCPRCGTGIAYRNAEMLPGIIDIQPATLDDPSVFPPLCQIQTAERIDWMATAHTLAAFERYPG